MLCALEIFQGISRRIAFLKDQLETFVEQLCTLIPSLISLRGGYSEWLDDGNLLSDWCVFVHKNAEEDRRQTVTVRRYRFERGKYEIWWEGHFRNRWKHRLLIKEQEAFMTERIRCEVRNAVISQRKWDPAWRMSKLTGEKRRRKASRREKDWKSRWKRKILPIGLFTHISFQTCLSFIFSFIRRIHIIHVTRIIYRRILLFIEPFKYTWCPKNKDEIRSMVIRVRVLTQIDILRFYTADWSEI